MTREAGPSWDGARQLREQDAWDEHAAFIDALEEQGRLRLAGPLADGGQIHRVMLVVECETEAAAHALMTSDPWSTDGHLVTVSVEPWTVLVGARRLANP